MSTTEVPKNNSITGQGAEAIKKQADLLAEKVRIFQTELAGICSQIHNKTIELNTLQNTLDNIRKEIIAEKERQKVIFAQLEKTYQQKVEALGIEQLEGKVKDLQEERLTLANRLEEERKEYLNQIKSFKTTIDTLSQRKKELKLENENLQKEIESKTQNLHSLNSSLEIQEKKYSEEEKKAIKELEKSNKLKGQIETEISQLILHKKDLEDKWEELKNFEKYLNKEQQKISKQEEKVEKLFHLLSENKNGI